MLKLSIPAGPFWLDVAPGVRFQLKPINATAMAIGRRAAGKAFQVAGEGAAEVAFSIAIAQWGVVAWEGVGDASGAPVDPTAERIGQLLEENWGVYEAVDARYVTPALLVDAEKRIVALAKWWFAGEGDVPWGGRDYCSACEEPCEDCPLRQQDPQSEDGLAVWGLIKACSGQVRAGAKGAYALDFGTVLTMAAHLGADLRLVAELLPRIEPWVLTAWRREDDT